MFGFKRNKNKTRADTNVSYKTLWISDNADILPNGYIRVSENEEIRSCANKIANLVSSMTIMLMENGDRGDKRIKNNLSKAVDINASKIMTRKTFIHKIVVDMLLTGNAVIHPEIGINGELINQKIMNANQISFIESGEEYIIQHNGKSYYHDEVLHFPLIPDDYHPFKGIGYVKQIRSTVENLIQAQATKTSFLRSKWKPPLIISIQADESFLEDPEKRKEILGSYRSDTEAGEPWLIPAGEISVQTVKPLTLNDLAIQDSIVLDKRSIAAAFNMPAFMVGVGDFNKTAYNNFISTQIMDIALIIQQEYTRKLIQQENQYFKLNPKSLMQYDLQELTGHIKEMTTGGMITRNEGRTTFDYAPSDAEGMDGFAILENYIDVADIQKQKKLVQEKGVE